MRVMIVDDSAFMRKVLSDMITEIGFEIAGAARNGKEAIGFIKELKPDVVTLDIEMPVMNGLEALEIIMKECPTPVVMLSTLTEEGAEETFKALQLGAVDFMTKPTSIFKVSTPENLRELKDKLESAAQSKLQKNGALQRRGGVGSAEGAQRQRRASDGRGFKKIVAIGTSTGGPIALQEVMSRLPAGLKVPLVVVQHMPPKFTKSLAERLNDISELYVKEAENNEIIREETVYIAPGDKHLKIVRNLGDFMIKLSDDDKVGGHRPSVDVMMNSLADLRNTSVVAVIMTGMGNDGTAGLKNLKANGAYIISQDEETSVVFGMPRAAIKAGIVDKISRLQDIADDIKKAVED